MRDMRQESGHPATERGTTLIETMATLVVMSLVLAVGVPFMSGYFTTQRLVKGGDILAGQFDVARQRAITRRYPVEVRLANPTDGEYSIHEDVNGNGIVDGVEIARGPFALGAGILFDRVDLQGDGLLVFRPSGMLRTGQGGRIDLVDDRGQVREMEIHASGMLTPVR